jgi:quinol monooxygenase YgiN
MPDVRIKRYQMIKVISKYSVTSGKAVEFRSIAVRLRLGALKEQGCLGFEILQDVKTESVVCMIEEWHDRECFAAHLQSNLFKAVMPKLHELQDGKPEITICRPLVI